MARIEAQHFAIEPRGFGDVAAPVRLHRRCEQRLGHVSCVATAGARSPPPPAGEVAPKATKRAAEFIYDPYCGSTAKLAGGSPRWCRSYMEAKALSRWRVNATVSNSRERVRFAFSLSLSADNAARSRVKAAAHCSYSASERVMVWVMPAAVNTLAATPAAKLTPRIVTSGRPAHIASLAVVCAPYGKVSSARPARERRAR